MSALTIYPQHLNSNTPHIILICMLNSHRDDIADSYLCVPIQEHTAVNIGGVGDGAASCGTWSSKSWARAPSTFSYLNAPTRASLASRRNCSKISKSSSVSHGFIQINFRLCAGFGLLRITIRVKSV